MELAITQYFEKGPSMKIRELVQEKTNPKYLGPTEKVAKISPVLGAKPKKQTKLMQKFFGGS